MSVLVDTSVWIEHLRTRSPGLEVLLEDNQVLCNPFVVGELACGHLTNREAFLDGLRQLPSLVRADDDEVVWFLGWHALNGRGMGLIDVHLLASAVLNRVLLWSLDKRLAEAAQQLGVAYR